jgi:hypothetical protein
LCEGGKRCEQSKNEQQLTGVFAQPHGIAFVMGEGPRGTVAPQGNVPALGPSEPEKQASKT